MAQVAIQSLRSAVIERLTASGMPERDAATIADHLIRAEERGHPSHGLQRLPGILTLIGEASEKAPKGTMRSAAPFVAKYSANGELGIVAVSHATEACISLASQHGIGMVGVTGYRGTTGMLGYYVAQAAEQGQVGIACCHSEYAVAPTGGRRAILGTNPIAVGFPASPAPFLADVATSAWSYGDLVLAMRDGRSVPEGVVQTIDGAASTDPNDADSGSQLPMAGQKGYALGLAVELLCGPLLGGKAGRGAVKGSDGTVLICLKIDLFRSAEDVLADASALFAELTGGPLAVGATSIRIPGFSSAQAQADTVRRGSLEINDATIKRAQITLR